MHSDSNMPRLSKLYKTSLSVFSIVRDCAVHARIHRHDCCKPTAVQVALDNSHLLARVDEIATKFAKLNRPVLIDITGPDELGELLFCRVLTKLLQHGLQFTASYVSILVHIEFVKNSLESSSFIISDLRLRLCESVAKESL